ncbi:hypothetical protein FRC03_008378, partial [Tulasnella sp. 419]
QPRQGQRVKVGSSTSPKAKDQSLKILEDTLCFKKALHNSLCAHYIFALATLASISARAGAIT